MSFGGYFFGKCHIYINYENLFIVYTHELLLIIVFNNYDVIDFQLIKMTFSDLDYSIIQHKI